LYILSLPNFKSQFFYTILPCFSFSLAEIPVIEI
jgi:hypothetical protein